MVNILPTIQLLSTAISNFNAFPFSPGFSIRKVSSLAESLPSHSWEYGAATQALLELYNPELSVFGSSPFPVPTLGVDHVKSLAYLKPKVNFGVGYAALDAGNGAAGDPASMGVGAVMIGKTDDKFKKATDDTVWGLINVVPRFWNGAISHRASVPELWADFMYMVPPFLAYYATDTGNITLLQESVHQCALYRQILKPNNTNTPINGAWTHILGPESTDTGFWASGNGWAAAGMARVLATVLKAPVAQPSSAQAWRGQAVRDLTTYIKEIVDGVMKSPMQDGLVRNYLNEVDTPNGFPEISGSSLIAATIYRMAVLQPQAFGASYITWADGIRRTLATNNHITAEGIATPAVNPLGWRDPVPFTKGSPEGNAFVVLLYTGWRDCVVSGRCKVDKEDGNETVGLAEAAIKAKNALVGLDGLGTDEGSAGVSVVSKRMVRHRRRFAGVGHTGGSA